jgi:hypothetical protein
LVSITVVTRMFPTMAAVIEGYDMENRDEQIL